MFLTAVVGLGLFAASPVVAADPGGSGYEPLLPKVPIVPEKVIVLDLTEDKANGSKIPRVPGGDIKQISNNDIYDLSGVNSQAMEALASIACLQGFINRQETTKIYLQEFPARTLWLGEYAGPGNASVDALKIGLIPYPLEYPELDSGKTYPALSWLLENYVKSEKLALKGMIIAPVKGETQRAAAITGCAFEDALFVSESMLPYLESEGLGPDTLPVIADLREMSADEAIEWSLKYVANPKMDKRVMIYTTVTGPQNPPCMFDYIVAARLFAWYYPCPKFSAGHKAESIRRYREIVIGPDAENPRFPYGTTVMGDVEQGNSIQALEEIGYPSIYGLIPNASLTSSIPTDPSKFRPADEPQPLPIEADTAYISWGHEADGDAIDFVEGVSFKNLLNDPATGQVPMGWRVNPVFIDLYPTLVEWYSKFHPEQIDIVSSMNDCSHPYPKFALPPWQAMYAHYMNNSNGLYRVMNHFNHDYQTAARLMQIGDKIHPDLVICGHVDVKKPSNPELIGDTVFVRPGQNTDGHVRGEPWESPAASEIRIKHEINDIKEYLELANPGEPCFIMSRGFHTNGVAAPGDALETMKRLQEDKSIKRKLVFCKPSVFAATFRAFAKSEAALPNQRPHEN